MTPIDGGSEPPAERRRHDRSDMLSTSLLLDLTTITVDPAYVEAAARRAVQGEGPQDFRTGRAAAMLLLVMGLLVVIAFGHTRRAAPAAARVRSGLVARVQQLTSRTDADSRDLERLRQDVSSERERALAVSTADRNLAESLRSLEGAAAARPVTGRGVVLRIADAPAHSATAARVQDRDLQRAVNIAWSAGAEAVAVNDQRVGPLTAIRQAGDSILIDYRPVASPYALAVIGDPDALERAFTVSDSSAVLRTTARTFDFGFGIERSSKIELAGTSSTRVVVATPVRAGTDNGRSAAR
jgi:uncharacterized protein YlxW (UPF0749 family)